MRILLITLLLLLPCSFAATFGEYNYSKYVGLNQQMQNMRANAAYQRAKYERAHRINIQYPTSSNPYPNIQRTPQNRISKAQRYSYSYYEKNYR